MRFTEFEALAILDGMDVQAARIDDQFTRSCAIEMERGNASQNLVCKLHVKVEIHVSHACLLWPGIRMDIHAFHGKIIPSPHSFRD